MSLCDNCYSPGSCCKSLRLISENPETGELYPRTFWDDSSIDEQTKDWANFPFTPNEKLNTYTEEGSGRTYSEWNYNCRNLLPSGRCGDYENRPELCRIYEPASDGLCVHYQGAEGTGEGL
ncbi:YkgJ family cysteine cluster protein [Tundrisphaera sp. TA3]|uniref:YkgJ family cysteine cluster protein n=1 Tax=Tundrisphaera sp. TA3 TaxID=3435775 RepID=UPI003EB6D68D